MEIHSVLLLFNKEDNAFLYKIIENLAKKYNAPKFLPHITMYAIVDASLSSIEDAVKDSIKGLSSFTVRGSKLNHSDNAWKTVFLEIELNSKLLQINEILSQKLSKYTNYDFQPHISLIYKKLGKLERENIIKKTSINREFTIDHVSILKFSNNIHQWEYLSSFTL